MAPFKSLLLLAATAAVCVRALPSNSAADGASSLLPSGATDTPTLEGYSDGFYYQMFSDGTDKVAFTNGRTGQFGLTWTLQNYHINAGKGWNPGSNNRVIKYSGSYEPGGGGCSLRVHGWTTNPGLVEYSIVDFATGEGGAWSGAQIKGTVTCDGAKYDIRGVNRTNTIIDGVPQTVGQLWSVRTSLKTAGKAISGTIDTACHFKAWKGVGLAIGTTFDYQVLKIESWFTNGSANLTVS